MSEEIKEILEEFENLFEVSEAPEHIIKDFNKIKNYITNLEEEIKKLNTTIKIDIKEINGEKVIDLIRRSK